MPRKRKRDVLQEIADSLTPEQACRLIQLVDPLTPEEQERFGAMTDDELLAELQAPVTEPTEAGNHYVLPGCEKDRTRGPEQADLF